MRGFFWEMTDFREEGRCLHELSNIILLVLCGLLADCATFEEIYDYACNKELVLRRLLALPAGIPLRVHPATGVLRPQPGGVGGQPEVLGAGAGAPIGGTPLVGHPLVIDGKQLCGTCWPGPDSGGTEA